MAKGQLAYITFIDGQVGHPDVGLPGFGGGPVDPGYGQGRPAPVRPDNGLPVGPPGSIGTLPVYPWDPTVDNSLPGGGGRPDNSLPGAPARPDNSLPGSGGRPDNTLPPTGLRPGLKFVVKWLACQGLILVPDNELPSTPPPTVDNTLPETAEPKA